LWGIAFRRVNLQLRQRRGKLIVSVRATR